MYNFCYNAEKIETQGNKDIQTLEKTSKVIETAINEELKKASAAQEAMFAATGSYFTEANDKGGAASATATANNGDNKEGDDKVTQAGHVNTNPIASSTSNVTTNNDTLKQQGQAAGQQAVQN